MVRDLMSNWIGEKATVEWVDDYPPEFMCQYARDLIDAGADAFIGHARAF